MCMQVSLRKISLTSADIEFHLFKVLWPPLSAKMGFKPLTPTLSPFGLSNLAYMSTFHK